MAFTPSLRQFLHRSMNSFGLEISRHRDYDDVDLLRQKILLDCNVVIDVGANHGQWARNVRRCGWGGRLISFEPIAGVAKKLTQEAERDANWSVYGLALGATSEHRKLEIAGNDGGASSFFSMKSIVSEIDPTARIIDSENVEVARLDQLAIISTTDSVYMKADVQGFELEVLKGSTGIIDQIAGLELELSLVAIYEGQPTATEVLDHCQNLGYRIGQIRSGFMDPRTHELLQADVVLVR